MKYPLLILLGSSLAIGVSLANPDTVIDGTNTTSPNLRVNGTGGVLFNGTLGSGGIPATGNGTRLMWYPAKAAFRVGMTNLSTWEDNLIGQYSMGIGSNSLASGFGAIALGPSSAIGSQAVSVGWGAYAQGSNSTAVGLANAYGIGSLAAVNATATADYSIALQGGAALGYYSMSIGRYTIAAAPFSLVVGQFNEPVGQAYVESPTDPIFVVGTGTGTAANQRKNGLVVRRDGVVRIAKRQGDIVMGEFGSGNGD